jgi:hypothetical protein
VTELRDKRVAVLTAAAREKSQAKTKAAEQAIRALIKRGEPITFQAVQREAGVSHAFLCNNPDLRARVEHRRARPKPDRSPATPADTESTLVLALTTQIEQMRKRHHQEVHALRAALEQAHCENLELRRELARRGRRQPRKDIVEAIATTT